MRTQREYMEAIKNEFVVNIKLFYDDISAYSYCNKKACERIKNFKENVKKYGLQFSNCYHANGIGNNNEYMIYVETMDADGFVIQKNVASFYYCYGIYGGCYVSLTDLSTGQKYVVGRAR